MRPERKKDSATLEKILNYEGAREAFDKLVEDRADPRLLERWLSTIAALPKAIQHRSIGRRELGSLRSKVSSLVSQIELANQSARVFGELFPFVTSKALADPQDPLSHLIRLPILLREYARILDVVCSKSPLPTRRFSPRNQAIGFLLYVIKESTRRYHYEEVAVLLNAADNAGRNGDDGGEARWDPSILKQRVYRDPFKKFRQKSKTHGKGPRRSSAR
jgi:hypothetical protein